MAAGAAGAAAATGGGPGKSEVSLSLAWALASWLVAVLVLGNSGSSAVELSTATKLFLETGKDAKFLCSFKSSDVVSPATSVTWSFLPEGSDDRPKTFFYYSDGKEYNGKNTQFEGRASWAGNFTIRDVSIKMANMQPIDNGTYFCDVKNPPDIISEPKPVEVRVVEIEKSTTTTTNITTTTTTTTRISKPTTLLIISLSNTPVSSCLLLFCCFLASCPSYLS